MVEVQPDARGQNKGQGQDQGSNGGPNSGSRFALPGANPFGGGSSGIGGLSGGSHGFGSADIGGPSLGSTGGGMLGDSSPAPFFPDSHGSIPGGGLTGGSMGGLGGGSIPGGGLTGEPNGGLSGGSIPGGGLTGGSNGGLSGGSTPGPIGGSRGGTGSTKGPSNVGDLGPSHYKPSDIKPDVNGLNASGEGGNPSFSYSLVNYRQGNAVPMSQCQGTLTKKEGVGGVATCSVSTAAHCLVNAEDVDDPRSRPSSRFGEDITEPDEKTSKVVSFSAPDFGNVRALAILHPSYVANNHIQGVNRTPGGISIMMTPAPNDIGLLVFQGEACEKTPAKVLPLATSCESNSLKVTSRWQRTTFAAKIQSQESDRVTVGIDGTGIKQGDSGGALFCTTGDKQTVIGVLSTGGDSRLTSAEGYSSSATYAGRSSTEWAMQTERDIFAGKELAGKVPKNEAGKRGVRGVLALNPEPSERSDWGSTH